MSDQDFDRTVFYPRGKPVSGDINTLQSQQDRTLRDFIMYLYAGRARSGDALGITPLPTLSDNLVPQSGFLADGFQVQWSTGMNLSINAGLGFLFLDDAQEDIGGVSGLDDLSPYNPLVLTGPFGPLTVNAPVVTGTSRIDIVEVTAVGGQVPDNQQRDIWSTGTQKFVHTNNVNKQYSFAIGVAAIYPYWDSGTTYSLFSIVNYLDVPYTSLAGGNTGNTPDSSPSFWQAVEPTQGIVYKEGLAVTGAPVAPVPDFDYIKIAEVLVHQGDTALAQNRIKDLRYLLQPNDMLEVGCRFTLIADGTSAPTMQSVSCPAGAQLVVIQPALSVASGATNSASVLVFAGAGKSKFQSDLLTDLHVHANFEADMPTLIADNNSQASVNGSCWINVEEEMGVLTSGNLTDLADPSKTNPVTTGVAVGQPYYRADLSFFFVTGITGPQLVNVDMSVVR